MAGALAAGIVSGAGAQQAKGVAVSASELRPTVIDLTVSGSTVTDVHLRPLFTTTIRLPEPVTSVAVGAPTLFEVEHSDEEPRLVFVTTQHKRGRDQQPGHRSSIGTRDQHAAAFG
jgi:hypothetical protein